MTTTILSLIRRRRAAIATCALLVLACGGGEQATPPSKTGADAAARPLPPIPTQPLRLLPAGVRELVSADLAQMRGSPHFATAERWIRRYACLDAESSQWLLARTDRVVLATFGEAPSGGAPKSLAVLRGQYQSGDLERALSQASALLAVPATAPAEHQRGRFRLLTSGSVTAAQLGNGLIAVGDGDRVLAALDIADGKQPAFDTRAALVAGVDTDRWLSEHTAAVITRVSDGSAKRIGRELSAIGGRRLGEGLSQSSAALGLVLAQDLRAQAQVLYPDARAAADAADGLRSVMGRADLVLRLTGLPSALERTRVGTEAERLTVTLALSAGDLERVSTRLQPLLENGTPACGTQAARALDPQPRVAGR